MRITLYILFFLQSNLLFCQSPPYVFDKKLSTWDDIEVPTIPDLNNISFSRDEKYLAAGSSGTPGFNNFLVWNIVSGKIHKNLSNVGKPFSAYETAFSPDGKYLVSVGTFHPHKGIKIWKSTDFSLAKEITYDTLRSYTFYKGGYFPRVVLTAYFTPDSKYLITADTEGMIKVWETSKWKLKFSIETNRRIWFVNGTNDGKKLISSTEDGKALLWNIENEKLILTDSFKVSHHTLSIAISPDNNSFSTNANDTLRIRNLQTWIEERLLLVNDSFNLVNDSFDTFIISVDFNPQGKYFASGHMANNNAKLWSTETYELLLDLLGDINFYQNETDITFVKVKFSPGGKYLALSNSAGFIYLYKAP